MLFRSIDAKGAYFNRDDVMLVIEVGATSLRGDLGIKRTLYADQGIPEYWVVDLPAAQIHQLWQPAEGSFQNSRSVAVGEALQSVTLPGLTIETNGIL